MDLVSNKVDRLIRNLTIESLNKHGFSKKNLPTLQDIEAHRLGMIMFYYIDTVGLRKETVFKMVKDVYNAE